MKLLVFGIVILLSAPLMLLAQPAAVSGPTIGYVYPAGGSQGSSFKVAIGGQALDGGTNLLCSHEGVTAKFVRRDAPITQGQLNNLRDELRALMEKRKASMAKPWKKRNAAGAEANKAQLAAWSAADAKALADIQRKIEAFQRQPTSPAIADMVILQVTVQSNVPAGNYQVRLQTARGLSNPLTFCIGSLPEVVEPPPAQENFSGLYRKSRIANEQTPVKSRPEIKVSLPVVVNGQVYPSEVDRYRFYAKKGQHIIASVSARELIPFLADAVPGWFQATVSLSDSKGNELAYADDFRFHPDPVLHIEVPADGEYIVAIKDSIFRGREDFVYRLSLGEIPFISSVFPLGGRTGASTAVELTGWNLPQLAVTNSFKNSGTYSLVLTNGNRSSNVLPFRVDDEEDVVEKEPNNNTAKAQSLQLPIIINGRINYPGDLDVYRFDGKAGDEVVIDAVARRLGSPLDTTIRLLDSAGNLVASNDDAPGQGAALQTHHADSFLKTKLPNAGVYLVQIADTQRQGGPEFAYRLRISPPKPDFELQVVPATVNARPGLCFPVTVQALRKDGFKGEIRLVLNNAPTGFTLTGGVIPAGQNSVRATLGIPAQPGSTPVNVEISGRAIVAGDALVRKASPADDMMQAFFYRHLVPAADMVVFAGGKSWMRNPLRVIAKDPVQIPVGGTATVAVAGPAWGFTERVQLALSQPPEGIEIEKVAAVRDRAEIILKADPKLTPGQKGNLIVEVFPGDNVGGGNAKSKGNAARAKISLGALPAITYEVVAAR